MEDVPKVNPGEWVRVGGIDAVVSMVYDGLSAVGGNIEVVYLDRKNMAINEDVKWGDDHWKFAIEGPCGGYADYFSRLRPYVKILRAGHPMSPIHHKGAGKQTTVRRRMTLPRSMTSRRR